MNNIISALQGAGALAILLGPAGGMLMSRNVTRSMAGLTEVVDAVRNGDPRPRPPARHPRRVR